jgi:hypothetical protein
MNGYSLYVTCVLLPEYVDVMKERTFSFLAKQAYHETMKQQQEQRYEQLSPFLRNMVDLFTILDIDCFTEYSIEGNTFSFVISKGMCSFYVNVMERYEMFLTDILVPMTSEITECRIEPNEDRMNVFYYSDAELRKIDFCLKDQVKTVEHTYSKDGKEILETRVVYKQPIPQKQFLELNRAYEHHKWA